MTLDFVSTNYALDHNLGYEGNSLMSGIVSNFYVFLSVKLICSGIIVIIMSNTLKINKKISNIGMRIIIGMMLLVVANNLFIITGSAINFGFTQPNSMTYPGRVFSNEIKFSTLIADGNNITEWGLYDPGTAIFDDNTGNIRVIGGAGDIVYAIADWTSDGGIFFVDSNKDVGHITTLAQINYSDGWYTPGTWPNACSNCNEMYKIGTLTQLNGKIAGVVDSDGNLFLSDGVIIRKFTKNTMYSMSTYKTLVSGQDYPAYSLMELQDMQIDEHGYLHLLITRNNNGVSTPVAHTVYNGLTRLNYTNLALSCSLTPAYCQYNVSMLIDANQEGYKNFTLIRTLHYSTNDVYIEHYTNNVKDATICETTGCLDMTDEAGLLQFGNYLYANSPADHTINLFATNYTAIMAGGFNPGAPTGEQDLTYNTASVESISSNYYNSSPFIVQSDIDLDSGFFILGSNYGIDLREYWWTIDLIDPNGVIANTKILGHCVDAWEPLNPLGTCSLHSTIEYTPPPANWISGSWSAKLYEVKIGQRALIDTSSSWNVYNATVSANASSPGSAEEGITSGTSPQALNSIDGWTSLLGLGVNSISKFLFAMIIIVVAMIIGGIVFYRSNALAGAVIFGILPYTFFAFISYIPSWTLVILGLIIAIKLAIFR